MVSVEKIASTLNLNYDKANEYAFGNISGYNVMISYNKTNGVYNISTNVIGGDFSDYAISSVRASAPAISNISVNKSHIVASVMRGSDESISLSNVVNSAKTLTGYFATNGMQNSCGICNNPNAALNPYKINDNGYAVCPNCEAQTIAPAATVQKDENIWKGLLGAFLGSLVGVAAIVIVYTALDMVAAYTGIAMALASLKGYQMLGGKLTKKGVILSLIIMIAMTFVADQINWAIGIADVFQVNIIDAFFAVPSFISQYGVFDEYLSQLLQLLLYTGIGVVIQVVSTLKSIGKNNGGGAISKLEQRF